MAKFKNSTERRQARVRRAIKIGANGRPRLSVFRSSKHIYAQIIDDLKGGTVVAASSMEKSLRDDGKAREVPEAIRKATDAAKRNLIRVPLREGRTLHHDVLGRHGAGKVFLRAAPPGTGIIAGGPMRAVFDVLGMQDIVAKSIGSSNPYNMVRATFDALKHQDSPRSVAQRRNIKVSALQARRTGVDSEAVAD